MANEAAQDLKKILANIKADRWLAHQFLFKKRHPLPSPAFHPDMVSLFAGQDPRVAMMTFRDGAKSTVGEEELTLGGELQEFLNCLIIGSSADRAIDRLRSVKNEIANNDLIEKIFSSQVGETWAETKIIMKNGTCIQAFGREQSLRGVKHLDVRPDFVWVDDLEDEETCKDLNSIKKVMKWFMGVLMPACQKNARFRITGTALHPRCVIVQLCEDPEWTSRIWPIEYIDEDGRKAAWPEKFSLEDIDKIKKRYERAGTTTSFNQEYLCKAEDEEAKPFKQSMVRVVATPRSWQPVYAAYDPARTTDVTKSAQTGKAVWSWVGTRLIIWKASGHFWRPDEIITDVMEANRIWKPIQLGIEKDGLELFIEQPLRQAQLRTGEIVPYRPLKAPDGKIDFIKGLQPFFMANEVEMAEPMPDLVAQMLSFPSGRIDILNALAYAPRMRPGLPVYEDFGARHVFEILAAMPGRPYWLCLNAVDGVAAGVLCQLEQGCLRVYRDWILEGDTPRNLRDILESAALESEGRLKVLAHPKTLEAYSNTGMRMAGKQKNAEIKKGYDPARGRDLIQDMLRKTRNQMPEVAVCADASWVLRGFSGGYALEDGLATKGPYKVIMEGLESFVGLIKAGFIAAENDDRVYATSRDGRQYLSSMRPGHA